MSAPLLEAKDLRVEIGGKIVVDRISFLTGAEVSQAIGVEEGVSFPLPKELASPSGLRAEEK